MAEWVLLLAGCWAGICVSIVNRVRTAMYEDTHTRAISGILKEDTDAFVSMSETERGELASAIVTAAQRYEISPYLVLGVIRAESAGRSNARNKRCAGLMQVNVPIWDELLREEGIITSDDDYCAIQRGVMAGCYILSHYIDVCGGKIDHALAKFGGFRNAGHGARYVKKCKSYLKEEGAK